MNVIPKGETRFNFDRGDLKRGEALRGPIKPEVLSGEGKAPEVIARADAQYAAILAELTAKTQNFDQLLEFSGKLKNPEYTEKYLPFPGKVGEITKNLYDAYSLIPTAVESEYALDLIKRDQRAYHDTFERLRSEGKSEDANGKSIFVDFAQREAQFEMQEEPHIMRAAQWANQATRGILQANQLNKKYGAQPYNPNPLGKTLYAATAKKYFNQETAINHSRGQLAGVMGGVWAANALISQAEQAGEDIQIIPASAGIDVNFATDFFILRGRTLYLAQVKTQAVSPRQGREIEVRFAEVEKERSRHANEVNTRQHSQTASVATRMNALTVAMRQADSAYNGLDFAQVMVYVSYPANLLPYDQKGWERNPLSLEAQVVQPLPDIKERR